VLIGYAGSGYKGMQINTSEKTIEGDIFKAFVAAGAISKANADDPKKSSLVRCARTDKGVHAAGNVISLKLIVEDPKIVEKINENLPPQIRVWGMERTNNAFSCYQTCDSRWYEYLIPTYSFVPPHPDSYMGKKLAEYAEKEGVLEEFNARQADVADFWAKADEEYIKPILDELDPELRKEVMAEIHATEELPEGSKKKAKSAKAKEKSDTVKEEGKEIKTEEKTDTIKEEGAETMTEPEKDPDAMEVNEKVKEEPASEESKPADANSADTQAINSEPKAEQTSDPTSTDKAPSKSVLTPLESAIKRIKAAYIVAKKAYRISPTRKDRVQAALSTYIGTHNFHNYTIQKMFSDPSSKRVIRSFTVAPAPIIINETEWLSLKVHGQSFMMHQIRKMVAMAALLVRCGSDTRKVMEGSFGHVPISIPKAPGLGLLLERPVFDTYNEQAVSKFQREKIDFGKFEGEMEAFKQREIYERIFREEERDHQYVACSIPPCFIF
jgi:tRNA pseudouridine38-40 synthase